MSDADVGDLTSVPEPIEPECTRIMRRLTSEDPKPIPARDPGDGEPWAKGSTEIAIPCGHMASIAHEKTAPAPRRKAHAKRARSRRSVDKR